MPTYYRPSERKHKRVVYKSIDPAEPKRDRMRMRVAIGTLTIFVIAAAVIGWMK